MNSADEEAVQCLATDLEEAAVGLGPWENLGPYPKNVGAVALDARDFMAHYGIRVNQRSETTLKVTVAGGKNYTLTGGGKYARDIVERLVVRLSKMRGVTNRAISGVLVDFEKGESFDGNLRAAESYVECIVEGCRQGDKSPFKEPAAISLQGEKSEMRGGKASFLALADAIIQVLIDRQDTAVSLKEMPPFLGSRDLTSPVDVAETLRRNWEWMRYLCDLSLATNDVVSREVTGRVPHWSKKQATSLFRALVGPWESWTKLGLDRFVNGFDVCCCYVVLFRKQQGQARITADGPRYLSE